jgi:hypothetical protein
LAAAVSDHPDGQLGEMIVLCLSPCPLFEREILRHARNQLNVAKIAREGVS